MSLLEVRNLHTELVTPHGTVKAVNGIDFQVSPGEVLALVGESGSGKSMTALSIMGLLPKNTHKSRLVKYVLIKRKSLVWKRKSIT
ncbi:ATP-binding cassette domain-containing protein [Paenibacillus validus]|uniref:ATP-binding cassette domain-containing protein n=1 Tax=Paenibacillus validus TaxID=44253 RepID=UPI001C3FD77D|nr:ATP-binding cassette domain-containing protein [Paenibacillus validus]MED4601159.1 ATP-binding cassette domain-containing protein [Paenibacillus validus]MED4606873.1 ATP-binding cassette domain-containing protein [Paenibacillus validus]